MYLIGIRVCSPRKAPVEKAHCCDLYTDPMIRAFHERFHSEGVPHALLSRYYGIMRDDKHYKQYDDMKELDEPALLEKLTKQCKGWLKSATKFYYWNHRPLTHDKWVKLLRQAGFQVINVKGSLDQLISVIRDDYANQESERKARELEKLKPKPRLVPKPGQQSLTNWGGSP